MSKEEKLLKKLLSKPKDFTFEELETLLRHYGYVLSNKGMTSGSRIEFRKKGYEAITMHKPHAHKELLPYQIKRVIETLRRDKKI